MDQGHVPSQDWFPAKAGQIRRSRTRGLTRRLFTGIKEGKERKRHFIVRCWPAGRISWLDPSPSKRFFTYCKPSSLQERSKGWFVLLSLHRAGAGRAVFFSSIGNWAAAKNSPPPHSTKAVKCVFLLRGGWKGHHWVAERMMRSGESWEPFETPPVVI